MGHANLKFWKAWEHPDDEQARGDKRTLIVAGKVEVKETTTPILEETTKPIVEDTGRSQVAKTLYLTFRTWEAGDCWKPVWFEKEVKSGDYDEVHLLVAGTTATGGRLKIK